MGWGEGRDVLPSVTGLLIKRMSCEETGTLGKKMACEDRGREQSDAATSP